MIGTVAAYIKYGSGLRVVQALASGDIVEIACIV